MPSNSATAADVDRMATMAMGHVLNSVFIHTEHGGSIGTSVQVFDENLRVSKLWVLFDPNDMSGQSYGCLNKDCRTIKSMRLEFVNLTNFSRN